MQLTKYISTLILILLPAFSGCNSSRVNVVESPGDVYTAKDRIDKADIKVALEEHNRIRADVGVGKLTWSDKISNYAQAWADYLAATTCRMKHRPREGKWKQKYGENLFSGTAGFYSIREAIQSWENEKADYHYGTFTGKSRKPIGHYTQVIWKNSVRVGCGQSLCNGKIIVACNYDPPGNYIGQKPY